MKKLGEGWQYGIYDLGNGRVFKKFHSLPKSYWVILKNTFPFQNDPIGKVPSYSRSVKRKAIESFNVLKRHDIPRTWIGNPKFLTGLDFEQDKCEPLHEAFEKSDTAGIKKLIDRFIDFNKDLFKRGVIDKGFNITKNYGLSKDGAMILTDIGELFDDPQRIRQQLKDRAWDKPYVAGCIKNKEAREYFIARMDEEFGIASK
jgi:hypothetical protein